ncbi:MAG: hypothetical protein M3552_10880 [Planctomycetota bacterium]|nr:hypothetical protein [Planctomycetota bacterium]
MRSCLGWRFVKSSGSAHAYGRLFCPGATRGACIVSVYGTPRNPAGHARYLLSRIDGCEHC